ncbi:MAG TPA: hypothetical protein VGI39_09125, partial [Polyangiaceae bacterium]
MPSPDEVVASWSSKDRERAVLPADRELIDASGNVRFLIVELVLAGGPTDELFDACAVLGRFIAQRGGSPTLASATLDHLADATGAADALWLAPGRAALAEGFAATVMDDVRREAHRAWEFPSCAVPLGQAAFAIVASHPSEDEEVVSAWAARVAKAAARAGARRAV